MRESDGKPAHEISYQVKEDHVLIKFSGELLWTLNGDLKGFNKLKRSIRRQEEGLDIILDLSSNWGGYTQFFDELYSVIKRKCRGGKCQVTTKVANDRFCNSSCVPLFMVGDIRQAGPKTRFGFHAKTFNGKRVANSGFDDMQSAEDDLRDVGVNEAWIQKNIQMFYLVGDMKALKPPELEGSGIITEIVSE